MRQEKSLLIGDESIYYPQTIDCWALKTERNGDTIIDLNTGVSLSPFLSMMFIPLMFATYTILCLVFPEKPFMRIEMGVLGFLVLGSTLSIMYFTQRIDILKIKKLSSPILRLKPNSECWLYGGKLHIPSDAKKRLIFIRDYLQEFYDANKMPGVDPSYCEVCLEVTIGEDVQRHRLIYSQYPQGCGKVLLKLAHVSQWPVFSNHY